MDLYLKCVMTIIAGALTVIAINQTIEPDPALAFLGDGPTFGDWKTALNDNDPNTTALDILDKAPIVVSYPVRGGR